MLENTRRVFERLGSIQEIQRFTLIGGTAIALVAKHRLSEDLDFAVVGDKLNPHVLQQITKALIASGCHVKKVEYLVARFEFEESGLNIDDYHVDFSVDGVKLTFVSLDPPSPLQDGEKAIVGGVRVASLRTLFELKALLLTQRVTSRDLFDLYWFATHKKWGVKDIFDVVKQYHPSYPIESVVHRLLDQPMPVDDPGFESLVPGAITLSDIRQVFSSCVNEYEVAEVVRIAESISREEAGKGDDAPDLTPSPQGGG